jgi:hypothetical protein
MGKKADDRWAVKFLGRRGIDGSLAAKRGENGVIAWRAAEYRMR